MLSSGDDVHYEYDDRGCKSRLMMFVEQHIRMMLKRIRVRKCLHLCGVDGETGESVELADGVMRVLVPSSLATTIDGGMAVYA